MPIYESPPDAFNVSPPCDADHAVPSKGICRGTEWSQATTILTGDWRGRIEYGIAWLTLPPGASYSVVLETFTGTVDGR